MIDRGPRPRLRAEVQGLARAAQSLALALAVALAMAVAATSATGFGLGPGSRPALAAGVPAASQAPRAADAGVAQGPHRIAPLPAGALAPWTGGLNLYRDGVFTTQSSWLYCTAADIQIIRNMIEGTTDHSAAAQTTYFDWMRTKNRYDLPLSAGIDPAGWTAGMQHFVDERYELVSSPSFGGTLRTAVTRMRLTGLPVALAVAHGNHGWVLNGFTASADPAATANFEITSLSVTGPLWGLQSKNGYDMRPNTTLSVEELKAFFTRWQYDPLPMIWDGSYVSIQPRAEGAPMPPPAPAPRPAPAVTPRPAPDPTPVATPPPPTPLPPPLPTPTATPAATVAPALTTTGAPTLTPAAATTTPEPHAAVADPGGDGSGTSAPGRSDPDDPSLEAAIDPAPGSLILVAFAFAFALAVAAAAGLGALALRRRH